MASVVKSNEFKMVKVGGELPSRKGGRGAAKLSAALDFCREAEGDWCQVAEYDVPTSAGQCASNWKKHELAAGYEFASRTETDEDGNKIGRVYARYTGQANGNGKPAKKTKK